MASARPTVLHLSVGGEEVAIPIEFSEPDRRLLDLYTEQCDALARCSWFATPQPVKFNLRCDEGVLSFASEVPPDDVVAAFLHRLRPLILQDEPASFVKVAGIVGRRVAHPLIRNLLKFLRLEFEGLHAQSVLTIKAKGPHPENPSEPVEMVLNSLAALQDWLNSYEYHRDAAKRARLDAATGLLPPAVARVFFLGTLANVSAAIFTLGELVAVLNGVGTDAAFTLRGWRGGGHGSASEPLAVEPG